MNCNRTRTELEFESAVGAGDGRAGAYPRADGPSSMCPTIEVSEEFLETVDNHVAADETREEFLVELVHHYESEGTSLWEGYGGPP
jgi:hypothetical protein